MARLRDSQAVAASATGDDVPTALLNPYDPIWSDEQAVGRWRAAHALPLVHPVNGSRRRHAGALTDWCTAHGIDPKRAQELTGWTARMTAMERAAARSGADYVRPTRPR